MKIIGLDVGEKRIGVAKCDTSVRIAIPQNTIAVDGTEFQQIAKIAQLIGTDFFVLGLPRSNQGTETAQSEFVKKFAVELKKHLPSAKIRFQDESLTSVEAEARLKSKKSYRRSGKLFKKGEVDSEAATIILQDFLESFASRLSSDEESAKKFNDRSSRASAPDIPISGSSQTAPWDAEGASLQRERTIGSTPATAGGATGARDGILEMEPGNNMKKTKKNFKPLVIVSVIILSLLVLSGGAAIWYFASLTPVGCSSECKDITFSVEQGDSPENIAKVLKESGLIKSALAFQINARLSGEATQYQVGSYTFNQGMSSQEISGKLARGEINQNVFNFTIVPGQNIFQIQESLKKVGYSETEIVAAFSKTYSSPVLKDKPADTSLEGYLYPETYEFYKDTTVESILQRAIDEMNSVIIKHNFEQKFAAQGLSLNQGLTLASIVTEESVAGEEANVATVFLNRINSGMTLGSDVTAKYAADLLDPSRTTYTDNSLILEIDSPYNTRKYAGLPPGPIASPSLASLEAVANPTDNDYLYFLTGDDGVMYYSNTESGHNQNAAQYCQKLCSVAL